MSHGSYDLNLGSEILILGGDIMSRSWPNIGDSYGIWPILVDMKNIFSPLSTDYYTLWFELEKL